MREKQAFVYILLWSGLLIIIYIYIYIYTLETTNNQNL